MVKRILIIFTLMLTSFVDLLCIWSTKDTSEKIILPFVNTLEMRKKQRETLETSIITYKKREEEKTTAITKSLNKINNDIIQITEQIKKAQAQKKESLNKKLSFLSARKQNLLNQQDLWQDIIKLLGDRLTLLNETCEYLQTSKFQLKFSYTWNEFRNARAKIAEYKQKINEDATRNNDIKRQLAVEKEATLSLQKQIDVKIKEHEKIIEEHGKAIFAEIADMEHVFWEEKLDRANLLIEKLSIEDKYCEEKIELLQNRLNDSKNVLYQIENRLLIDENDIKVAKLESDNEETKSLQKKEEYDKIREPKRLEREKLVIEQEFISQELKKLKEKGRKDFLVSQMKKSNLKKINSLIAMIDKELLLLEARKNLVDTFSKIKKLDHTSVDARYNLITGKISLDETITAFKSQYELEISILKNHNATLKQSDNYLTETKRIIDSIKIKEEKLKSKKVALFKDKESTLHEILENYQEARQHYTDQLQFSQDYLAVCSELIHNQETIVNNYELIINDLESYRTTQSIWKRSGRAISINNFKNAFLQGEEILKNFFWDIPVYLAPSIIIQTIKQASWLEYLLWSIWVLFFIIGFIFFRWLSGILFSYTSLYITQDQQQAKRLHFILFATLSDIFYQHFTLIYTFLFLSLPILYNLGYHFGLSWRLSQPFYNALFCVISIPILIYLVIQFLLTLQKLETKLKYFCFSDEFNSRFIIVSGAIGCISALLLPLKKFFFIYSDTHNYCNDVILAFYTISLLVLLMFFFAKDEVLALISSPNRFLLWVKKRLEKYYYLIFFFIMGLLILSNPYVGYQNLAWYLLFAIPLTTALIYLLFLAHHYIRKYSVFLFITEDEDEIHDRFEYAKTYYGFFIIFSFLFLLFITGIFIARIWGFSYAPQDIWKLLSETWTITPASGNKLGFVELMMLILFIVGGFIISSLIHKFILNKFFDILRTEPGLQNTVSRILHYIIIVIATLFGFISIHLEQFILVISGLLGIGLGLALKDIITDVVSGFFVLLERHIEIGSYIQLDNIEGTVHKIAARSTTIVTGQNFAITIPNKDLLSKNIINWGSGRFAVGVEIKIHVTLDTDPELVKSLLNSIVQNNNNVLKIPAPVIRLEEIEGTALLFFIRAFISARRVKDYKDVASQLRYNILETFNKHNIALALVQQVQITQENQDLNSEKIEKE
jgi:small-conductance mechanosensitive channel